MELEERYTLTAEGNSRNKSSRQTVFVTFSVSIIMFRPFCGYVWAFLRQPPENMLIAKEVVKCRQSRILKYNFYFGRVVPWCWMSWSGNWSLSLV